MRNEIPADTCQEFMMVLKERELPKTDEDKDIEKVRNISWLIDKLRAEADKTAEEHRRGEHFMNEIEKYANTLNEEEKELFYGDLNERWNRVIREESKRLSKLWK